MGSMSAKHNITVAIERDLLKKARAIAARRGRSVSALLAEELRELVDDDRAYATAQRRARGLLQSPRSLGGARMTNRDAAHERNRVR